MEVIYSLSCGSRKWCDNSSSKILLEKGMSRVLLSSTNKGAFPLLGFLQGVSHAIVSRDYSSCWTTTLSVVEAIAEVSQQEQTISAHRLGGFDRSWRHSRNRGSLEFFWPLPSQCLSSNFPYTTSIWSSPRSRVGQLSKVSTVNYFWLVGHRLGWLPPKWF